ncbi:hypothetical protein IQ235_00085 [Oscillatoriales cyanobacterium LEGE 11467]|uniref:Uncharacterized protein n=1 Tax=Zarconia navalis LEGE 11467 TaxID=1828826 RepID=A0A928VW30_9CYAN|nr:hypothetical protein [Zarconia navalis]MBE9039193.1 hypothetical protein [Zarconia navalis LEGE 11467]
MVSSIAFLICTESGDLAEKSLLLAESLRCFGGKLKDAPIYSVQPRAGDEIESQILEKFQELGVVHKKIILNTDYTYYPIANKVFVCAYGEQNINTEILVFLDSDQVIFREPQELILSPDCDTALRPVDRKNLGSTGKKDRNDDYWQKLDALFGMTREIWVETTVEKEKIRGYWNSGMIAARKESGLFSAWLENFKIAMAHQLIPESGIFHLDQLTLAATIASKNIKFSTLSPTYNYPLHKQSQLQESDRIESFDEVVSIHYHWMFKGDDWRASLENLAGFDRDSERYRWLYDYLSKRSLKSDMRDRRSDRR